jgi:hypothetical protein
MLVVWGGVWAGDESPMPNVFLKNPQPASAPASVMATIAFRMCLP